MVYAINIYMWGKKRKNKNKNTKTKTKTSSNDIGTTTM